MRPIDADCLECKIASFVQKNSDKGVSSFLVFLMANKMLEMIRGAPVLTLDDLRHKGEWRHRRNGVAYCTACLTEAVEDSTDYCPSCGADMRGGGEDA